MKKPKDFETEADLCSAFIDSVDSTKWTAYAETAGWDILLVRGIDGFQIGVQAKLKMNTAVIDQALDGMGSWYAARPGPDCRALLIPSSAGFERICTYLALEVITPFQRIQWGPKEGRWRFSPSLPDRPESYVNNDWPEWCPAERHKLPEYVPDVRAGSSSPVQLTEWKIKAIKLAILLERNGRVFRTDFRHLNLHHRRWKEQAWLSISAPGYVAGPNWPDLKKLHPRVYGEIEADFDKWKPKTGALL